MKQLGQLRPANTTAASIYSPDANVSSVEIQTIVVCNTGGATPNFRIFHDDNGTTYDETTALFWDEVMVANTTQIFSYPKGSGILMDNTSGNIAVRTSANDAITFTIYGTEVVK